MVKYELSESDPPKQDEPLQVWLAVDGDGDVGLWARRNGNEEAIAYLMQHGALRLGAFVPASFGLMVDSNDRIKVER